MATKTKRPGDASTQFQGTTSPTSTVASKFIPGMDSKGGEAFDDVFDNAKLLQDSMTEPKWWQLELRQRVAVKSERSTFSAPFMSAATPAFRSFKGPCPRKLVHTLLALTTTISI